MTRRGRGEGSIHRRPDGRWVGQLSLGWAAGKRQRRTVYGRTRKEVSMKLHELRVKNPALGEAARWSVAQWMTYWLNDIAAHEVRPQTLRSYRSRVDRYIIPLIGNHRLDKLAPQHVRAMYTRLRQPCPDPVDGRCRHSPHHGRAEASVRHAHAVLSRALKIAEQEGHIDRNVAKLVRPPKVRSEHRTPLTVGQAKAVLEAAAGDDMEARWYMALYLGMRQGEVLGLRWSDVDLVSGTIRVRQTLQKLDDGLGFGPPKSAESMRDIPVPPLVLSRLKIVRARHHCDDTPCQHLVWHRGDGQPLHPKKDWQAWRDLLAAADVPHVALHAARNTTATLLMSLGVPAAVTRDILGHTTVLLTQDIYSRGDDDLRRAALGKLEESMAE